VLHLRRHHRLGLSLWLVITLLFTQLASAAYACPQLRAAAPVVSDSAASADMAPLADMSGTPDMADCDGMMMMMASPDGPASAMDPAQPQLCKLHCSPASQTVQASAVLDAPSAPPLLLLAVLDWAPAARQLTADAVLVRQHVPAGAVPPGAPPLYIALLALRH
jgi:hypothetical protein